MNISRTTPRKEEHLDIFGSEWPRTNKSSLLEEVELLPAALPQHALEDVDLSATLFNRAVKAPLLITALTGGTPRTGAINLAIARVAQRLGIGMGLGSQRAMLEDESLLNTFAVRRVAPDIPLLANIGIAQLPRTPIDRLRWLVDAVEADGLAVHLNAAQELVQPEGDLDFRGTMEALEEVVSSLKRPVIVKGVGSGIDPHTAQRMESMGVAALDLAGVGGTSWPALEGARSSAKGQARYLGEMFRDWGIPTAANILLTGHLKLPVIASGGIVTSLDAARALALGADYVGMAGAPLNSLLNHGEDGLEEFLRMTVEGLRRTVFLAGCRRGDELRERPRLLGPNLRQWSLQIGRE